MAWDGISRGDIYARPNGSTITIIKCLGGSRSNKVYLCEEYSSTGDFLGPIKVRENAIYSYEPAGMDESAIFNRKG